MLARQCKEGRTVTVRPPLDLDVEDLTTATTGHRTMSGDHAVVVRGLAVRAGEINCAPAHFLPALLGRGSETVVFGCLSA